MAKPMLPTKAWAVVREDGEILSLELCGMEKEVNQVIQGLTACGDEGLRPARVTITEGDGWQDPKTIPLRGKEKIHVVDRLGNQALVLPSDLAHAGGLECVTAPDHGILTIVGWQPLPAPPRRKR